jgi:hypothetical protein
MTYSVLYLLLGWKPLTREIDVALLEAGMHAQRCRASKLKFQSEVNLVRGVMFCAGPGSVLVARPALATLSQAALEPTRLWRPAAEVCHRAVCNVLSAGQPGCMGCAWSNGTAAL